MYLYPELVLDMDKLLTATTTLIHVIHQGLEYY